MAKAQPLSPDVLLPEASVRKLAHFGGWCELSFPWKFMAILYKLSARGCWKAATRLRR